MAEDRLGEDRLGEAAGDAWPEAPDAWEQADRAWEAKWSDDPEAAEPTRDPEADPVAPPSAAYRNREVTIGSTTDAYGDGMRAAGPHIGLGLQIAASMLLFVGLGILFDRWLDTSPWGVIAGAALGMVGIVALVVRVANEGAGGGSS
ncbi:MAG: AtpZ/AtpI family protein [Bacteroidota bacterium]